MQTRSRVLRNTVLMPSITEQLRMRRPPRSRKLTAQWPSPTGKLHCGDQTDEQHHLPRLQNAQRKCTIKRGGRHEYHEDRKRIRYVDFFAAESLHPLPGRQFGGGSGNGSCYGNLRSTSGDKYSHSPGPSCIYIEFNNSYPTT